VTGTILPRLRRYKIIPMIGMVLAIVAVLAMAWRGRSLTILEFQVLLAMAGAGFGASPPLCSTVLQNSVSIHNFGTAVASMQFCRNLFCTIFVAVFGAMVLVATGGADGTAPVVGYSAEGFDRLFYVAAASFCVAFVAMVMLEEKPLATGRP
jgi:hypothetical protein